MAQHASFHQHVSYNLSTILHAFTAGETTCKRVCWVLSSPRGATRWYPRKDDFTLFTCWRVRRDPPVSFRPGGCRPMTSAYLRHCSFRPASAPMPIYLKNCHVCLLAAWRTLTAVVHFPTQHHAPPAAIVLHESSNIVFVMYPPLCDQEKLTRWRSQKLLAEQEDSKSSPGTQHRIPIVYHGTPHRCLSICVFGRGARG